MSGKSRSETSRCRGRLARYCEGIGLDVGYGGDGIVPWAINCDLGRPYTSVGADPQHIRMDCRNLGSVFRNESLDFIFSSHLIEDFEWLDMEYVIVGWRLLLKRGGRLVLYVPDEQVYRAHCERTGQGYNLAHKNADFSLETFKRRVVASTGPWRIEHEADKCEDYSWEMVLVKE